MTKNTLKYRYEKNMGSFFVIAKKEGDTTLYAQFAGPPAYHGFRLLRWSPDFDNASHIGNRELRGLNKKFYKKYDAYVLHFKHKRVYEQTFEPLPALLNCNGDAIAPEVHLDDLEGINKEPDFGLEWRNKT